MRHNPAVARRVGPWGRTVGFATYPLYLIHNRVGLQVMAFAAPFTGALGAMLAAAAFCTALAFAIVPFEKRLQGALRQALFGRAPAFAPADPEPLAR